LVAGFLVVIVGVPLFFLFYDKPTCFDSKMNGDEAGVDCGGSCELICSPESLPLLEKGDPRVLKVARNIYEVVAVYDNPNVSGEVYRAPYVIKIYEAGTAVPIKIIESSTYIPTNSEFIVFEGPFELGERIPDRATLEWKRDNLVWKKNFNQKPNVEVRNRIISKEDTTPRVDATVVNNTLDPVSNIELIVLISDETGNTIAASKTFIDQLEKGESVPVVFAWPEPWSAKGTGIEIITRLLPDRSFLR
jgi:hypothetical protein